MLESYFLPIVSALLLFVICQGIGWPMLPKTLPFSSPRLEAVIRLLASFGAGLWAISLLVLCWGMVVGLSAGKILVLWTALLIGCVRSIGPVYRTYRIACSGLRLSAAEKAALLLIAGVTLWALVFDLVPPLLTDSIRYHFGVPHRWLVGGTIENLPHFSEQHLVMMWQHASLLLIGLDQVVGAKVFLFLACPLTLLAVMACVRGAGRGRGAALCAGLVLAVTPTFFGNSVLGGVDAGLAFFTAMTLLFVLGASGVPSTNWLWAGAMAGLALCTKWQGAVVMLGAAAVALKVGWNSANRREWILGPFWVLSLAALIFLPWAVRNLLWAGDPFYPFLSRFWDEGAAAVAGRFDRLMDYYGLAGSPWWQYLLYPFHLTFESFPIWFGGRFQFESSIGPVYLVLLPFTVLAARRNSAPGTLLLFALIVFLAGFGMGELPRFWMPVWVALSVAAGWVWQAWGKRARLAFVGFFGVAACWNLADISTALNQKGFAPIGYHRSRGGAPALYARIQPEWRAATWVGSHRPHARILLVGLDGNLFWTNPVVLEGPFDDKTLVEIARESQSTDEMAERLKARGIELIAVDPGRAEWLEGRFGYMGWDLATRARIRDFFRDQVVRIHQEGSIRVGEIR